MTDMPICIEINGESVRQEHDGSITGIIYWSIGDVHFPDDAWNDFIVVVLSWWIPAIRRLTSASSMMEALHFMDGPFSVECAVKDGVVTCSCISQRQGRAIVVTGSAAAEVLLTSVSQAARKVIETCALKEYSTAEVVRLRELVG